MRTGVQNKLAAVGVDHERADELVNYSQKQEAKVTAAGNSYVSKETEQ